MLERKCHCNLQITSKGYCFSPVKLSETEERCERNCVWSFQLGLSHNQVFLSVRRFSTQHLYVGGFSYIWSFVWYFRCADKTERTYAVHSYYTIRSMLRLGLWAWAGTRSESQAEVWAWSTAGHQPAVCSASTSCSSSLKLQRLCPDCHRWKSFSPRTKLLEWMFSCCSVPK